MVMFLADLNLSNLNNNPNPNTKPQTNPNPNPNNKPIPNANPSITTWELAKPRTKFVFFHLTNIKFFCYLPISKIRVRVSLGFSIRVRITVQIWKYLSPPRP